MNFRTWLVACAACLLQFAVHVPAALSQQADLEINTPAVTALRESLRQRHREHLQDYYVSGAIGLTQDGQIAIRDANLVPLAAPEARSPHRRRQPGSPRAVPGGRAREQAQVGKRNPGHFRQALDREDPGGVILPGPQRSLGPP